MTAQELAHDFFLGIRAAMSCPDVSVTEYEGVIAHRIKELVANEREACARVAENARPFEGGSARCVCNTIANAIREMEQWS